MVSSKSEETESADGMRGRIAVIENGVATVECHLAGDACVVRARLGELVLLDSITA
ncbi:hypothetical protein BDI4_190137 [Burkholderia diffusa]|uniref:hypothetical protein n=1 Tax=Burkholderia diffusa TaxID=488732 RepID=UPI001CB0F621|nr:hypothetical protein [Burkholderia diffusa]CAG9246213.1 hypothetical protein BDI4_190137 [Burkholderia diffusa]